MSKNKQRSKEERPEDKECGNFGRAVWDNRNKKKYSRDFCEQLAGQKRGWWARIETGERKPENLDIETAELIIEIVMYAPYEEDRLWRIYKCHKNRQLSLEQHFINEQLKKLRRK